MTAESGTRWSRWHSCSGACVRRPVACPAAKRRNGWRPPGQTKWPGSPADRSAALSGHPRRTRVTTWSIPERPQHAEPAAWRTIFRPRIGCVDGYLGDLVRAHVCPGEPGAGLAAVPEPDLLAALRGPRRLDLDQCLSERRQQRAPGAARRSGPRRSRCSRRPAVRSSTGRSPARRRRRRAAG